MKRLPLLPTLLVVAAVAVMIGLGIWQLQRAQGKDRLIAEARDPARRPALDFDADPPRPLPPGSASRVTCTPAGAPEPRAGQNMRGETGYRYLLRCRPGTGPSPRVVTVDIGWSPNPALKPPLGARIAFTGTAHEEASLPALTAREAVAPLQPSKPPAPAELPNNHLLYALQWFFFAAAAAAIYLMALNKRRRP
jgi:cytochrome oxidase assembly protein ShyY1